MDQSELMLAELQKAVKLLSIIAVGSRKQREQIGILSKAGFQPTEIAKLIGTSPNTVRVELNTLKKKKNKHNSKLRIDSNDQ
jgi:IS30 family transposase